MPPDQPNMDLLSIQKPQQVDSPYEVVPANDSELPAALQPVENQPFNQILPGAVRDLSLVNESSENAQVQPVASQNWIARDPASRSHLPSLDNPVPPPQQIMDGHLEQVPAGQGNVVPQQPSQPQNLGYPQYGNQQQQFQPAHQPASDLSPAVQNQPAGQPFVPDMDQSQQLLNQNHESYSHMNSNNVPVFSATNPSGARAPVGYQNQASSNPPANQLNQPVQETSFLRSLGGTLGLVSAENNAIKQQEASNEQPGIPELLEQDGAIQNNMAFQAGDQHPDWGDEDQAKMEYLQRMEERKKAVMGETAGGATQTQHIQSNIEALNARIAATERKMLGQDSLALEKFEAEEAQVEQQEQPVAEIPSSPLQITSQQQPPAPANPADIYSQIKDMTDPEAIKRLIASMTQPQQQQPQQQQPQQPQTVESQQISQPVQQQESIQLNQSSYQPENQPAAPMFPKYQREEIQMPEQRQEDINGDELSFESKAQENELNNTYGSEWQNDRQQNTFSNQLNNAYGDSEQQEVPGDTYNMARGEDTPVQQPNNNSLSDFNQLRDQHRFDSENLSNEFSNNNSYNNNNFEKNFYDMDNQKESNEWNVENTLDQSSNNSVNSALDNRFGLGNNNEDDNEDNDDYNDNAGNRQEAPSRYQAGNGYLDDNEDDEDDDFSQQDSAMGSRIQSPAEDPEHSFEAHDELKHRQEGALFGARIENDAPMHFDMENKYELENKGAISSDLADSRQINPKFSHLSNDHVDIESSGALAEHRNVIIVSVFFLCGFAWVCRKALFGILFRSKRNRRYRRVGNSDGYESNPDSTASGYASDRGCVQGLFKHGNYTMLGTTTGDNKNGADGDDISLGSGWSENENGEGGDQSWEKW